MNSQGVAMPVVSLNQLPGKSAPLTKQSSAMSTAKQFYTVDGQQHRTFDSG